MDKDDMARCRLESISGVEFLVMVPTMEVLGAGALSWGGGTYVFAGAFMDGVGMLVRWREVPKALDVNHCHSVVYKRGI